MSLAVRLATPDDLPAALALDPMADGRERRDWITRAFAGHHGRVARVAELEGKVVGFAVIGEFFGHPLLELIATAKAQRRQGVASALMTALEDVHGGERLFVSTNESNTPMRTLLVARDYKVSGLIEDLDPGDPELFFVKYA